MAAKKSIDREKLIQLVRDTPCLWDPSEREYMDADITSSEWQRIGDEIGIEGADCKIKFKKLKDTFRRKRKEEKDVKSGSKGTNPKKWPFYEFLTFLDPVVVPIESSTNLDNCTSDENGNESGEDEEKAIEKSAKKCKMTPTSSNARKNIDTKFMAFLEDSSKSLQQSLTNREMDEEGYFGQTVAVSLKRLIPQQKGRAKVVINQALYDVEFNTPYRELLGTARQFSGDGIQSDFEKDQPTFFCMP